MSSKPTTHCCINSNAIKRAKITILKPFIEYLLATIKAKPAELHVHESLGPANTTSSAHTEWFNWLRVGLVSTNTSIKCCQCKWRICSSCIGWVRCVIKSADSGQCKCHSDPRSNYWHRTEWETETTKLNTVGIQSYKTHLHSSTRTLQGHLSHSCLVDVLVYTNSS